MKDSLEEAAEKYMRENSKYCPDKQSEAMLHDAFSSGAEWNHSQDVEQRAANILYQDSLRETNKKLGEKIEELQEEISGLKELQQVSDEEIEKMSEKFADENKTVSYSYYDNHRDIENSFAAGFKAALQFKQSKPLTPTDKP